MMEEDQEQRFSCKFCSKTFINGKCLGGHMRGHLALISAKKAEESDNCNKGFEGYGLRENHKKKGLKIITETLDEDGYGLRENPKKSWRASGSKPNVLVKSNLCKECGKGFPSLRALSGHMRCHSIKGKEENICKKCGKGFDSMRALFGHMRSHSKRSRVVSNESVESKSDYEPAFAIPKKKLRTRYKVTSNPSCSNLNASSSVVTDNDDVEEVAMCLMMLSRGVKNWDEFNSVTNTSNNDDSLILEAQSSLKSHVDTENEDGVNLLRDDDDEDEKQIEKLDSCVLGPTNGLIVKNVSEFCLLDFGSAIDDENKVELGVSVDESLSCDKLKNPLQDGEFAIELVELGLEKGVGSDTGLNQADSDLMKPNPVDEAEFGGHDLDLGENSFEMLNDSESKREYKCRTCDKIFSSHRALGGHRTSHKTVTSIQTNLLSDFEADFELEKLQFNDNSVEQEVGEVMVTSDELRKSKDHECSICFKVFASGQALGGHKRAHYIGLTDQTRTKEAMLIKQELPDIHNMFDLNLPLSLEDGAASDVGFKPWWVGSDREYEPLVIFN